MTENEKAMFEQIAANNADLGADTPETDHRKDGIYYHATVEFEGGNIVHYQLVVDGRVVALVRVAEDVSMPVPAELADRAQYMLPRTTFHPITLTRPDGTNLITTNGVTFKAPEGILNRTMIKAYVMPRVARFLVRLYGLGL